MKICSMQTPTATLNTTTAMTLRLPQVEATTSFYNQVMLTWEK